MRKLIIALMAVIALIGTGCSVSVNSSTSNKPTHSKSSTPAPVSNTDEDFANLLRQEAPGFTDVDTDLIIQTTHIICDQFDSGQTFEQVLRFFVGEGISMHDAAILIGASVGYSCPEHQDIFDTDEGTA